MSFLKSYDLHLFCIRRYFVVRARAHKYEQQKEHSMPCIWKSCGVDIHKISICLFSYIAYRFCHMHLILCLHFLEMPFVSIWRPYTHPKYKMSSISQFGFQGSCSSTLSHTQGNGNLTSLHTNNKSMSKSESSPESSSSYPGGLKLRRLKILFGVSPWSHI